MGVAIQPSSGPHSENRIPRLGYSRSSESKSKYLHYCQRCCSGIGELPIMTVTLAARAASQRSLADGWLPLAGNFMIIKQ